MLDDDIREETKVIMRPKKPPRPKSEAFLNKQDPHPRRKRFSAFGVSFFLFTYIFFYCGGLTFGFLLRHSRFFVMELDCFFRFNCEVVKSKNAKE